nr:sigma factor-like helix-turn-helix DNA-binding protein [Nocardioides flavescens]
MRACVLELGATQRQVVELRLFHDWSADEIAQHVGLGVDHVQRVIVEAVSRARHRRGDVHPWEVPALPVQTVAAVLGA